MCGPMGCWVACWGLRELHVTAACCELWVQLQMVCCWRTDGRSKMYDLPALSVPRLSVMYCTVPHRTVPAGGAVRWPGAGGG